MKTQIIQLSQKEDTISVKDKMSWCQNGRILLVWPAHGKLLNHKLEIMLVRRYAEELGCELGFVTQDPDVRMLGTELGICVFTNIQQAQDQSWKKTQRPWTMLRPNWALPDLKKPAYTSRSKPPTWMTHPITRAVCIGLCILAILALAIFILPGARVFISPNETIQSVNLDLYASPDVTSINFPAGSLPVISKEVIIEGSSSISTTGSLGIPENPARTTLMFTNQSVQPVLVSPGTVVSTKGLNPVRFTTQNIEAINLLPRSSINIDAQAIKPGSGGNLPANSLSVIEGDLGQVLEVTNPEPALDGNDILISVPDERDLQALRDQNHLNLIRQAVSKLQESLADGDVLILPSVKVAEVVEESNQPAIGEPGDQMTLFQRVRISAQVATGETIRSFVTPILDASLANGYSAVTKSITVLPLSAQETEPDGRIHWQVNVTRHILDKVQTERLAESIRGVSVAKAIEEISNQISHQNAIQIALTPSWWPRLPLLPMRITFIQDEAQ